MRQRDRRGRHHAVHGLSAGFAVPTSEKKRTKRSASCSPRSRRALRDPGGLAESVQPPLGGEGPGVVGAELGAEVLISRQQQGLGFGAPALGGQAAPQQALGGGGVLVVLGQRLPIDRDRLAQQ